MPYLLNDMTEKNLREADLFILDMDGTLYLGDKAIPGARDFTRALIANGRKLTYLTNNSSRSGGDYIKKLSDMGFPCGKENVLTSGMTAAGEILSKYPGAGVFAVGTRALLRELEDYGVSLVSASPDIVLVGFDRELDYEKLERACSFLRRGARFIATNPDLVCPMPEGEYLPDCGSICALIKAATGRDPEYMGKPNPNMILEAARGIDPVRAAVVGDRLYTDIAAGAAAGAITVCVLSGETNREMLDSSPIKPDFVFPSVLELSLYLNLASGL